MKKIKVEVEFDAPDEANWIATGDDGLTCWYAEEPEKDPRLKFWCPASYDSYGQLGVVSVPDWENSLRKI